MSLVRLARLNLTVTRDKSPTDPAQVPAIATVDVHKQGARVAAAVTVPDFDVDVFITVQDVGRIRPGDKLFKNTETNVTVTVEAVPDRTTIMVASDGLGDLVLVVGDRLVAQSPRPTLFKSSFGLDPYPSGQVFTDGTAGRLPPVYLRERFVDVIISGSGVTTQLLIDQPSGEMHPVYNVRDMTNGTDIQAAIDALPPSGGVVFIPSGTYLLQQGLVINKDSVTLQGEGHSTLIRPLLPNQFDLITVNAARCKIANLMLSGQAIGPTPGDKSCLVINGPAAPGGNVTHCHLEDLKVQTAPRYGLWLKDALSTLVVNCEFIFNVGDGVRIEKATIGVNGTRFINCSFSVNNGQGVVASQAVGLTFYGCVLEGNQRGWELTKANGLEAQSCERIEVYSCYFEDAHTTPQRSEQFILFNNCRSGIVDSCWFQGNQDVGTTLQPNRAVRFNQSPWARLTSNAAENLRVEFAFFSSLSHECVEFGNRVLGTPTGIPKFTMEQDVRVLSLSRATLGLYTHANNATRPAASDVRAGSLIWNVDPSATLGASNLQLWDGAKWQNVRTPAVWLDVRDFGLNIQNAIDALPTTGGIIVVPRGTYTLTAGLTVTKEGVTLLGEGPGTIIRAQTPNVFDLLTITASRCRVANIQFDGAATTPGIGPSKSVIVVAGPPVASAEVRHCYLENVIVKGSPVVGLSLRDLTDFIALNCEFIENQVTGCRVDQGGPDVNASLRFIGCSFSQNVSRGMEAVATTGLSLIGCSFIGNRAGIVAEDANGLNAGTCFRIEVLSCRFENALTGTSRAEQFLRLDNCYGPVVDGCWFNGLTDGGGRMQPKRGVMLGSCQGARLSNNTSSGMNTELALFASGSDNAIELGNREFGLGVPRLTINSGVRVLGLSRGALGLYAHADQSTRPASADVRPGSLIWVESPEIGNSKLQIWDGAAWKNILLA